MTAGPHLVGRGFTLIELMVTITIIAILASLAAPSFSAFIRGGQVRSAAESVQNALQLARATAVQRNERTTFALGAGSAWSVSDAAGATVQQSRAGGEGSAVVTTTLAPAGATSVTFNGFGRVTNPNGNWSLTFSAVGTPRTMQIQVSVPGGQIRLCDPDVVADGDPRRCLP